MQRWVNLGESLLAVPRPATAYVSQVAHPAVQILPPAKTESKSGDALVSIFVWDHWRRAGFAPRGMWLPRHINLSPTRRGCPMRALLLGLAAVPIRSTGLDIP